MTLENYSPKQIAEWLAHIVYPDQVIEVRSLSVGSKRAISRYFRGTDLESMVVYAQRQEQEGAKGIYFGLNPIRDDQINSTASAKDGDVLYRRWLLVDIDPTRPADTSADESQHAAAWEVADLIRQILLGEGFGAPLICDSGNGYHLLYPIFLKNDESSKNLCKEFLKLLGSKVNIAEKATVDSSTYNASRICRFYGTISRKGNDPSKFRRGRFYGLLDNQPLTSWQTAEACFKFLSELLGRWKAVDAIRQGKATGNKEQYAQAALKSECDNIRTAPAGTRNNQLNKSSHAIGTLVGAGLIDRQTAIGALTQAGLDAGLEIAEIKPTLHSGLTAGGASPRQVPDTPAAPKKDSKQPTLKSEADLPIIQPDQICTLHDLAKAGNEITWVWEGWIQRGVINVLGAEAGTGKTRCVCDLLRRIRHGEPWPDGQPMNLSPNEKSLWVLADNNHDEMVSLGKTFDIMDNVLINTTKDEPYLGIGLDDIEDLARLEAIIKAVKPIFVVIDTVGNSTDKKLHASEDMKAYYLPLQIIARRNQCAFLCLTHLNSAGGMLGKRVLEKARSVLKMTRPDEDQPNRRKLEVFKSNSLKPAPLGITMGETGNTYDFVPPQEALTPGRKSRTESRDQTKVEKAKSFIREFLKHGSRRLGDLLQEAKKLELKVGTIYDAKDKFPEGYIQEFLENERKFWKLNDSLEVDGGIEID